MAGRSPFPAATCLSRSSSVLLNVCGYDVYSGSLNIRVGQSACGGRYPSGTLPMTPPPLGLAQQSLQGLLHADQFVLFLIHPGIHLGGIPIGLLVKDEQGWNRLSEFLLKRSLRSEDRALGRTGPGHRRIIGHEGGRLLPTILDLDVDPLPLQLIRKINGLLVVTRVLFRRLGLAAVIQFDLHSSFPLLVNARIAKGSCRSSALPRTKARSLGILLFRW